MGKEKYLAASSPTFLQIDIRSLLILILRFESFLMLVLLCDFFSVLFRR